MSKKKSKKMMKKTPTKKQMEKMPMVEMEKMIKKMGGKMMM